MILSVSRRTDIPRFHFDWFVNRLHEGSVLVRNPVNRFQVSSVELNPETIDCIAFISKNPEPMLDRLDELQPYPYYMQFTLNAYGNDIEQRLPKKRYLLEIFKRFSDVVGPHRMVWRYSPILLNDRYTVDHHLHYFDLFAKQLEGYTDMCRISYLEMYSKIADYMTRLGVRDVPSELKPQFTRKLVAIADQYGISVGGCGNMDLHQSGIVPHGCVDAEHISRIIGAPLTSVSSSYRKSGCYCAPSVDVGAYSTCANGCVYCYANKCGEIVPEKLTKFDVSSPILCDKLGPDDVIVPRKLESLRNNQLNLFHDLASENT